MSNQAPKGYRCKLVAADGAYQYINMPNKLPRIVMAVMPTLRVNFAEEDYSTTPSCTKREYEYFGYEGRTLIYREVV